jgi:hypothetical protein
MISSEPRFVAEESRVTSNARIVAVASPHFPVMTSERTDEMRELSRILGRMREVCDLMREDSQSKQFRALWDEFIRLHGEAEFRLRRLESCRPALAGYLIIDRGTRRHEDS